MEEIISLLKNIYETNPELILTSGSIAGIALLTILILLLSRGKKEEKAEVAKSADLQQIQSTMVESSIHTEEEIIENEELETEEISEFIKEEPIEALVFEGSEEATEETGFEEEEKIIEEEVEEETKEGLFSRLRAGLSRTQAGLIGKLDEMLSIRKEIDNNLWDDFEEALITADLGVGTTMKLRNEIERKLTKKSLRDPIAIKSALREEILQILKNVEGSPIALDTKPLVVVVAGVNGVGKTTTIGKLAYRFRKEGKSVMVAAADTFRAAAMEQLEIWAKRVGSDFLKGQSGADPSAVAFDAIKASFARGTDVLIIDTAGRLHTKTNLMEELKKIRRVIGRELPGAPHETLLVLDATTGQNAVQQAKMFKEAIEVTGIVLTKLDGTAKGGVIVAIADELNIPVKFIGIGESLGDLREFKAEEFVEALFLTGKETLH